MATLVIKGRASRPRPCFARAWNLDVRPFLEKGILNGNHLSKGVQ